MQYRALYFTVLGGLIFLVAASLGNGIADRPLDYSDWTYRAFRGVCHQLPERSFHIDGVPMAVNARCFGIFSGLLAGWLLIPAASARLFRQGWPGILLGCAVAVNVMDFSAGNLWVWNSSNFSRFFFGAFLGVGVVCMLADRFIKTTNKTD
ncbi:MAG: DUF2085 domain-containing protein [Balneolaceae bacterium]